MDFLAFLFFAALLVGKVLLMRAVWKMAKEQGKSQWVCLIASFFVAWIVFLGLFLSGKEAKRHAELRAAAEIEEPETAES